MDVDVEERSCQHLRPSVGRAALEADDPPVLDGHNQKIRIAKAGLPRTGRIDWTM